MPTTFSNPSVAVQLASKAVVQRTTSLDILQLLAAAPLRFAGDMLLTPPTADSMPVLGIAIH